MSLHEFLDYLASHPTTRDLSTSLSELATWRLRPSETSKADRFSRERVAS
jgi:hypothetical protein